MRWTRIAFSLGVLLTATVSASALPAAHSSIFPRPSAWVRWSVDGRLVGPTKSAPFRGSGFEATWTGGAVLVWTKNGEVNSGAINAPNGANDIHVVYVGFSWVPFKAAYWSHDGTDVAPIRIAQGSNGFYITLTGGGVFDSALWSGGRVPRPIVPGPAANDARLMVTPPVF